MTTGSSEAINLQVPDNVDLKDFVGRRIFAIGKYQEETRTLLVIEATDLELLPSEAETIPVVETEPTPEPSQDEEETEVPSDTSGETTP